MFNPPRSSSSSSSSSNSSNNSSFGSVPNNPAGFNQNSSTFNRNNNFNTNTNTNANMFGNNTNTAATPFGSAVNNFSAPTGGFNTATFSSPPSNTFGTNQSSFGNTGGFANPGQSSFSNVGNQSAIGGLASPTGQWWIMKFFSCFSASSRVVVHGNQSTIGGSGFGAASSSAATTAGTSTTPFYPAPFSFDESPNAGGFNNHINKQFWNSIFPNSGQNSFKDIVKQSKSANGIGSQVGAAQQHKIISPFCTGMNQSMETKSTPFRPAQFQDGSFGGVGSSVNIQSPNDDDQGNGFGLTAAQANKMKEKNNNQHKKSSPLSFNMNPGNGLRKEAHNSGAAYSKKSTVTRDGDRHTKTFQHVEDSLRDVTSPKPQNYNVSYFSKSAPKIIEKKSIFVDPIAMDNPSRQIISFLLGRRNDNKDRNISETVLNKNNSYGNHQKGNNHTVQQSNNQLPFVRGPPFGSVALAQSSPFSLGQPAATTTPSFGGVGGFGTAAPTGFGAPAAGFGAAAAGFGAPTTGFGAPAAGFGTGMNQSMGTKSAPFRPFQIQDGNANGVGSPVSIQCITAMNEYKNKSQEELRLEDYKSNNRGPGNQSAGVFGGGMSTFGGGMQQASAPFGSVALAQSSPFSLGQPAATTTPSFGGVGGFGTAAPTGFGAAAAGFGTAATTGFGAMTTSTAPIASFSASAGAPAFGAPGFGAPGFGATGFGAPAASSSAATTAGFGAPGFGATASTTPAFGASLNAFGAAPSTAFNFSPASVPGTTPSRAIRRMTPSGDNLFQWLHAIVHNPSCVEVAPNVLM